MRPKNGLYHYTLGMPAVFNSKIGTVPLRYTAHAEQAAHTDRYGFIFLPRSLNTDKAQCIEVEYRGGYVYKLVYRVSYNAKTDLTLVCHISESCLAVATVWLNESNDTHISLDVSKYNRPNKVS